MFEEEWEKFKKVSKVDDSLKPLFENAIKSVVESMYKQIRVCPRLVAWREANIHIPKLIRQINRDSGKRDAYVAVINYLSSLREGETVVSKKVIKELKWHMTYGDFLLRCLELSNCQGIIKKIRFAKGKPGHKYIKVRETSCPFASIKYNNLGLPESFECLFNWNEAMIISGKYEIPRNDNES